MDYLSRKENLIREIERLRKRFQLSSKVENDYFNPGMMEYLDQSFGEYNEATGEIVLRFESKGTRYEGRTERIETLKVGDEIIVKRDSENPYNSNNFTLLDKREYNIGNMAAELCNAIAPLYDEGLLVFNKSFVSFVDPISKRSRYAKQGMVFVELQMTLK